MPMTGIPFSPAMLEEVGQFAAVGGIDGAGAHGEVMAVDRDIATVDIENAGDQRGAVEVLAPVLEQDIRLLVGEDADAVPRRSCAS